MSAGRSIDEANMEDNLPLEPDNIDKLRELALICALVAVGIVITVGTVWVGWEIGGVIP
jgi:hypothetical protein